MSQVTLGGDRLGAGNKQKVSMHNFERSTHDLSYTWRSTMASGTLVPFMSELALPGDTFDIDLNVDVMTHPTIGPLFGSFKVQLDVFTCPIRLYNGKLHMNMLNIGLDMAKVKLPQLYLMADAREINNNNDNAQINPSSIFSYLNIRGLGRRASTTYDSVGRTFNAIPYLSYFDIYKQYYSNKQEEIGAIIHNDMHEITNNIVHFYLNPETGSGVELTTTDVTNNVTLGNGGNAYIIFSDVEEPEIEAINVNVDVGTVNISKIFNKITWDPDNKWLQCTETNPLYYGIHNYKSYVYDGTTNPLKVKPQVKTFPLSDIDEMRENILMAVKDTTPFTIDSTYEGGTSVYAWPFAQGDLAPYYSKLSSQEGLLLKTYQSDLFNNWISTEWIDGDTGINAITSVDTTGGSFTIDTLQLSKKVYDMLNRIAVSGGTYDDWLNASYTHERTRGQENPAYQGGLIKELAFQEVVSNAAATIDAEGQPLGTLAGRGVLTHKHKGGSVKVKIDEPSYIIGIVSLTPRLDYSQGNKWDTNLKTMADLHQPSLDELGFQDLYTDQMAWWDTYIEGDEPPVFKSAGKQPAWINYMTNVNQVRGNFAEKNEQMWMTLNRRYEFGEVGIDDLTTYIDPSKFNHIFADTRLDAQNFWVQIGVNNIARRKMSAKLMPNL